MIYTLTIEQCVGPRTVKQEFTTSDEAMPPGHLEALFAERVPEMLARVRAVSEANLEPGRLAVPMGATRTPQQIRAANQCDPCPLHDQGYACGCKLRCDKCGARMAAARYHDELCLECPECEWRWAPGADSRERHEYVEYGPGDGGCAVCGRGRGSVVHETSSQTPA